MLQNNTTTSQTIYGFHAVESAINNDAKKVSWLWCEKGSKNKRVHNMIELAKKHAIPYKLIDRDAIDKKTGVERNQGVAATYNYTPKNNNNLASILKKESVFLLVLDGVQDPHNLGACLRSAGAADVDAVIAPKDRAVGLTPVVRKIASGAAENTPFIQVTNLAQTLKTLKDNNVWCYGATSETTKNVYDINLTGRVAIVMGSEGKGLRRLTQENCDDLFKIPMPGNVESLNVSVATGISLFEVLRQRIN